jgi:hypothetical protein
LRIEEIAFGYGQQLRVISSHRQPTRGVSQLGLDVRLTTSHHAISSCYAMLHISLYLGGFFAASQAVENVSEIYNVECKESLWEGVTENNSKRIRTAQIIMAGQIGQA